MKVILLLLCGLLIGCATKPSVSPKPPIVLTPEEAGIYEALFRHMIANHIRGPRQFVGTYFIDIQRADPSDAFLLRFLDNATPVKRNSQARFGRHSAPYDPETRNDSVVLSAEAIRWRGKNSVDVEASYYAGNLGYVDSTYRLIRQGDKWTVVEESINVLSDSRGFSAVDERKLAGVERIAPPGSLQEKNGPPEEVPGTADVPVAFTFASCWRICRAGRVHRATVPAPPPGLFFYDAGSGGVARSSLYPRLPSCDPSGMLRVRPQPNTIGYSG